MKNELYKDISREILERAEKDQRMRRSGNFDSSIDKENTGWLKDIVENNGWPTISKVGTRASRMA